MVKMLGSEWEPNVFIPAAKMVKTLDSPSMKPFLQEFNITAYGIKVGVLWSIIKRIVRMFWHCRERERCCETVF